MPAVRALLWPSVEKQGLLWLLWGIKLHPPSSSLAHFRRVTWHFSLWSKAGVTGVILNWEEQRHLCLWFVVYTHEGVMLDGTLVGLTFQLISHGQLAHRGAVLHPKGLA